MRTQPAAVRLNYNQTRYATRLLTLPPTHPLVTRFPHSLPLHTPVEADALPGSAWDEAESPARPWATTLTKILGSLNPWINRNSILEQHGTTPTNLGTRKPSFIIPSTPKDQATKLHLALLKTIPLASSLIAYTDGSLLEGNAGAGMYIYGAGIIPEKRYAAMGSQCEVFDAELSAILRAIIQIESILESSVSRVRHIWMFSDSQAALRRLQHTRPGTGHETTCQILQLINDLQQQYRLQVTLCWVPGHTAVHGNEIADHLAKTGSQTQILVGETPTTSIAWIRRQARASRFEMWQDTWSTAEKGHSYLGELRLKLDAAIATNKRFDTATIVQLRTGHGYFNSYLATTKSSAHKKIPSERCNCRAPHQTPEHLLLYCIRYSEERKTLRKSVRGLPWRLQTVLHTPKGASATVVFLQQTGAAKRPNILQWASARETED